MATKTNLVALAVVLVSLALLFGCAGQQQPSGGTGVAGSPSGGAPSTGGAVGTQPQAGGTQPSSGGEASPADSGPSAEEVQQNLDSYDSGLDESINEVGEYG
jgi:hypothetical protein